MKLSRVAILRAQGFDDSYAIGTKHYQGIDNIHKYPDSVARAVNSKLRGERNGNQTGRNRA